MDQTFRPLLDALKQIGVDPAAVDRAAAEAQRSGRSVRAVLINDQVVTEHGTLPSQRLQCIERFHKLQWVFLFHKTTCKDNARRIIQKNLTWHRCI